MLIDKKITVKLSEKELRLIEKIAKEQEMTVEEEMREIFQAGLSEMMYHIQHEV